MSRPVKFRVRDAKGKLIGFNRFYQGRWQCQMLDGRGSGAWSNGVLHGMRIEQFTGLKTNGVASMRVMCCQCPKAQRPPLDGWSS